MKLGPRRRGLGLGEMPPTRGHDLKHLHIPLGACSYGCPPHGGTT